MINAFCWNTKTERERGTATHIEREREIHKPDTVDIALEAREPQSPRALPPVEYTRTTPTLRTHHSSLLLFFYRMQMTANY